MNYKTIHGSAHQINLPDKSVHSIVTSPPYFGLRSYSGEQDVDWPAMEYAPMPGLPPLAVAAWRGPLGNEPTLEAYIGHLVLCLREWWRVLRDDGCAFVNLGDSYANDGKWGGSSGGKHVKRLHGNTGVGRGKIYTGLKPKDLCLVPQRFALAAQADGWYVRSVFPWIKRNAMPGSQQDRPTTSHEDWIMITKSARYYWDQEAIKIDYAASSIERVNQPTFATQTGGPKDYANGTNPNMSSRKALENIANNQSTGRYRRTADWTFESLDIAITEARSFADNAEHALKAQTMILDDDGAPICMPVNPRPYAQAHYATFPETMIEPLVLASTSAHGCCGNCGSPWRRVVERTDEIDTSGKGSQFDRGKTAVNGMGRTQEGPRTIAVSTGWEPTCTCPPSDPIPCTILDPFVGSGTTLKVAMRLGRSAVGVDISEQYLTEHVDERVSGLQFEMSF